MKTGRPRSSIEEEAHKPTKQQRISHASSRGPKRGEVQLPEPQAWLPAPMLGGEPLTDDASIKDYNGGIGCHVASVLEETLLLPKDMVELRGLRRNEVFLQTKRFLGMVCIFPLTIPFFSFFFSFLFDITLRCFVCLLFCLFVCFFFFLKRLFKALSGWKRCTTPSHSSWIKRENEGLLLCRH